MAINRAIVIIGPPQSGKDMVGTYINQYIQAKTDRNGQVIASQHHKFTDWFKIGLQNMLGLQVGLDNYELIEERAEFFGHSRLFTEEGVLDYLNELFGPKWLGLVAKRRLVADTQVNTYVLSEEPTPHALLALALELGKESVLIIKLKRLDHDIPYVSELDDPSCRLALSQLTTKTINNCDDLELLRLLSHGVAKNWLGIDE